jgi:hypothetical protein
MKPPGGRTGGPEDGCRGRGILAKGFRMFKVAISLQPSEMIGAWRGDTTRLLLPTAAAPQLRQKAAVRIQLAGQPVGATIVGTVVSAHGEGRNHRIELAPDGDSMRAVRMLLAAAKGEPVPFMQRAMRYLVRLPVAVAWGGGDVYMTTFCISEGGCGLKWSGPSPKVGQRLRLRFGVGRAATEVQGSICWLATGGSPTVGVRFEAGSATAAWGRMFADVARSGAPLA